MMAGSIAGMQCGRGDGRGPPPPWLACNVHNLEEEGREARSIRQEGQRAMATPAPVLIVDGNPQMTALLQRYLARQRVDTQAVSSRADAQAVLVQQPFGVVLTDAFLPSEDGLVLLRYIRQTVPGTRGILMTAFRAPALCQQALAAGAWDNSAGYKKPNYDGTGSGARSGGSACGSSTTTVVPFPGVLASCSVPW